MDRQDACPTHKKKIVEVVKAVSTAGDEEFIRVEAHRIIASTGAQENIVNFENNDLPGIYGAGAVQTLVNVYEVPPGRRF